MKAFFIIKERTQYDVFIDFFDNDDVLIKTQPVLYITPKHKWQNRDRTKSAVTLALIRNSNLFEPVGQHEWIRPIVAYHQTRFELYNCVKIKFYDAVGNIVEVQKRRCEHTKELEAELYRLCDVRTRPNKVAIHVSNTWWSAYFSCNKLEVCICKGDNALVPDNVTEKCFIVTAVLEYGLAHAIEYPLIDWNWMYDNTDMDIFRISDGRCPTTLPPQTKVESTSCVIC